MSSRRITLRLDVVLEPELIEGDIEGPHGDLYPFIGWIGLVGALERAAEGASQRAISSAGADLGDGEASASG